MSRPQATGLTVGAGTPLVSFLSFLLFLLTSLFHNSKPFGFPSLSVESSPRDKEMQRQEESLQYWKQHL